MTVGLVTALDRLPGYRSVGTPLGGRAQSPNSEHRDWLQRHNGAVALAGALRIFPLVSAEGMMDVASWNNREVWKASYGPLAPEDLWVFAEDAFGVQFGFLPDGGVARFWNETGEIEPLDLGLVSFLEVIADDPDETISYGLFRDALSVLGPLELSEHLAFRVETALGGELSVNNLQKMDALIHMRASGKIAQQIAGLAVGDKIDRAVLE
jgi:hypothetical protein